MDIGGLLEVLGNETRRKILRLLAEEPKYLIQLSKELNVSQQAILKHIDVLERYGLISSYEARGELPAPPRKYYILNRSFTLSIDLAPHTVSFEAQEVGEPKVPSQLGPEAEKLNACRNAEETLRLAYQMLRDLDERIRKLEEDRLNLVILRRFIAEKAKEAVEELCKDSFERKILLGLISHRNMSLKKIAEELNLEERKLKQNLKMLRARFSFLP